MITTVLCQTPGWADRSDADISRRLGKIREDEGNLLHAFAPPPHSRVAKCALSLVTPASHLSAHSGHPAANDAPPPPSWGGSEIQSNRAS